MTKMHSGVIKFGKLKRTYCSRLETSFLFRFVSSNNKELRRGMRKIFSIFDKDNGRRFIYNVGIVRVHIWN